MVINCTWALPTLIVNRFSKQATFPNFHQTQNMGTQLETFNMQASTLAELSGSSLITILVRLWLLTKLLPYWSKLPFYSFRKALWIFCYWHSWNIRTQHRDQKIFLLEILSWSFSLEDSYTIIYRQKVIKQWIVLYAFLVRSLYIYYMNRVFVMSVWTKVKEVF